MAFEIRKPRLYGNFKTPREKRDRRKTPKEKRPGNDPKYLSLVRQLPCCTCDKDPPSEVHHIKQSGQRGGGMRSPDKFGIPMCHDCHIHGVERVGSKREVAWFKERGIEPLSLAANLFANRHSLEAMLGVLWANTGKN